MSTLHSFAAGSDGAGTSNPLYMAPNGVLYGTTNDGGGVGNCFYDGCGTAFELRPSVNACPSVQCPWVETVLYRFTGGQDGAFPDSGFIADSAGNLYGQALGGGAQQYGVVYKLANTGGTWTQSPLYSFTGGNDGIGPIGGLAMDASGSLYGVTDGGGEYSEGVVYQLSLSGSNWVQNTLHAFTNGYSTYGPIVDSQGNLYGVAQYGGCCFSGLVFKLTRSENNWTYAELYDFMGEYAGPSSTPVMDAAGNLYGTTGFLGAYNKGSIYKLSPNGSGWTYTDLYDFTGGSDGASPYGQLVLDSQGNIYGTAGLGGQAGCEGSGCGVVFELTP